VETFLYGTTAMNCAVIGLFFLRFWTRSRDRFFLWFACAFLILGVERAVLGLLPFATEWREYVYLLRLFAFCVILYGIADKNRR
jgi:hypothetical protein